MEGNIDVDYKKFGEGLGVLVVQLLLFVINYVF